MPTLMLVLAAVAGWSLDDFCGTPPRPWPGPGPGPWIRKVLAMAGGVGAAILFGGNNADAVSIIVVGGIGGVFLASVGGMLMGGRMESAGQ